MTPEEVGERLVALLAADDADTGDVLAGVSGGGPGHERAVVDVPVARWWAAVGAARDPGALGCDFFDWLSAVDELDAGFTVVAHLWSARRKHGLLLRTRVPRDNPVVESVVDLFPGASWHERETYEMFGITFARHPDLRPLLLPPGFEGNPLRKEFVLASRVSKAWPGAKEPGESEAGGPAKRAPMRPPGVPDPNEWGPMKGKVPPPERPERPARAPRAAAAGERPERPARPAGERPERPARPVGERPERPARPAGERPERPARPAGERPEPPVRLAGERPERPVRPAGERPEPPTRPAGERPEPPARPAGERPEPPARPAGERPTRPPRAAATDAETEGPKPETPDETSGEKG